MVVQIGLIVGFMVCVIVLVFLVAANARQSKTPLRTPTHANPRETSK